MQKKLLSLVKAILVSKILIFNILAAPVQEKCDPFKIVKLTLDDGRVIQLLKKSTHSWSLSLLDDSGQTLWSKNYSEDFDSLWEYAYFIKIKQNSYLRDINKDGRPEFALSTWEGGNAPNRPAIIFTVEENELKVFKIVKEYPIESCQPLFK